MSKHVPLPDWLIDDYVVDLLSCLSASPPPADADPAWQAVQVDAGARYVRALIRDAEQQELIPTPGVLHDLAEADTRPIPRDQGVARVALLQATAPIPIPSGSPISPLPEDLVDDYLDAVMPTPEMVPGTGGDPVQSGVIYAAARRYARTLIRAAERQGLIPAPLVLRSLAQADRRPRRKFGHCARVVLLQATEGVTV